MIFKELKVGDSFYIQGSSVTMIKTKLKRIYGHNQKKIDYNSICCSTGISQFVEDSTEVNRIKQ
jgi:hypothetical protein|tara:strand:- start:330 stop:521 length:192 start_codon:yes stop_codon:yes gene_type:complete